MSCFALKVLWCKPRESRFLGPPGPLAVPEHMQQKSTRVVSHTSSPTAFPLLGSEQLPATEVISGHHPPKPWNALEVGDQSCIRPDGIPMGTQLQGRQPGSRGRQERPSTKGAAASTLGNIRWCISQGALLST